MKLLLVVAVALLTVACEVEPEAAQPARPTATPSGPVVSLDLVTCNQREATGTVRNNAAVAADVFIDVQFLAADGTLLGTSLDSVFGLRPGQTGNWQAPFVDTGTVARCEAEVGDAFES